LLSIFVLNLSSHPFLDFELYNTKETEANQQEDNKVFYEEPDLSGVSVFWIPGYPGPPALGPLQQPSFGLGAKQRLKPSKEDPHEEAPYEENNDKTAKDQKNSS
jgi:hypothetical protein